MRNSDRITTYIGTYTRRESFVNGKAEGIYIYHLDPTSGELTYDATVTGNGTVNPSFLTLAPDKSCLYAVNEITGGKGPHGTVSAFAIDPVTRHLSYLNQQSTHGLAPCYASIEPEERYCLVANYETGSVCVLPIRKTGAWERQPIQFSFPVQGPIPSVKNARMPIRSCQAPIATSFWQLTWVQTGCCRSASIWNGAR